MSFSLTSQNQPNTNLILHSNEDLPRAAGEKARGLQALRRGGLPVPDWFVILPDALTSGLGRQPAEEFATSSEPSKVKFHLQRAQLTQRFIDELRHEVDRLIGGDADVRLAVRLSLTAAQQDWRQQPVRPVLHAHPDAIRFEVLELWQTYYEEAALIARHLEHPGTGLVQDVPAIIVQRMVRADISGSIVCGNAISGRRTSVVVAAVYGLGVGIDSGRIDVDTYEVLRTGEVISRETSLKETALYLNQEVGHGVEMRMVLPSRQDQPCLVDSQCVSLAEVAWEALDLFDRPQVVDFAMEAGAIALLQTRRAPMLESIIDPDTPEQMWLRQPLVRDYPGVVTPLTVTVARRLHQSVCQELARALGLDDDIIRTRGDLFENVVGRVEGRVCLNGARLRELIDMLPQPKWHREQLATSFGLSSQGAPFKFDDFDDDEPLHLDTWAAGKMWARLKTQESHYESLRRAFQKRLDRALGIDALPLNRYRTDELVDRVRQLQRDIVDRWDAPAANEALAAIAIDLLRQANLNWCEDKSGTIGADLLRDVGDLPGTKAAASLAKLAREVGDSRGLTAVLTGGEAVSIDRAMLQDDRDAIREGVQSYLNLYGEVTPDGLAIEFATLRDNPMPLLREIGRLAASPVGTAPDETLLPTRPITPQDIEASRVAAAQVERQLNDKSTRRIFHSRVLALARQRMQDGENYRFAKTRVVYRLRELLLELGRRLYATDELDSPRHVLYLELEEILGYYEQTSSCRDLRGLVGIRWREWSQLRAAEEARIPKQLEGSNI